MFLVPFITICQPPMTGVRVAMYFPTEKDGELLSERLFSISSASFSSASFNLNHCGFHSHVSVSTANLWGMFALGESHKVMRCKNILLLLGKRQTRIFNGHI